MTVREQVRPGPPGPHTAITSSSARHSGDTDVEPPAHHVAHDRRDGVRVLTRGHCPAELPRRRRDGRRSDCGRPVPIAAAASSPATVPTSAVTSASFSACREPARPTPPDPRGRRRPRAAPRPDGRRRRAAAVPAAGGAPGSAAGRGRQVAPLQVVETTTTVPSSAAPESSDAAPSSIRTRPASSEGSPAHRTRCSPAENIGASCTGTSSSGSEVHEPAQGLRPRPPGRRHLAVQTGAPEHDRAVPVDLGGEPAHQRRLPDPWFAGHEHQAGAPPGS